MFYQRKSSEKHRAKTNVISSRGFSGVYQTTSVILSYSSRLLIGIGM